VSDSGQVQEEGLRGALSLHLLGILCAHEGRYEEAEAAFLRAVEANPEMACSYVELGLVYACRGEYARMLAALRRAVVVGAGGVRAYLGERPLGDITPGPAAEVGGGSSDAGVDERVDALALVALAVSHLAEGRDPEAAAVLEPMLERRPDGSPAAALLALSYLLPGEEVEATAGGIRRGAAIM
jgi:tetratricopeptide (TPR) repeat protein